MDTLWIWLDRLNHRLPQVWPWHQFGRGRYWVCMKVERDLMRRAAQSPTVHRTRQHRES